MLLGLLESSYPDRAAVEAICGTAGFCLAPEPDSSARAAELWRQALRRAAEKQRVRPLMEAVLADQGKNDRHPLFASLLDNLFSSPREPAAGPIDGLQAITAAGAGIGDAIASVQALMSLVWRTAVVKVNGRENGTGFLVGDNLLLTAAHVVDGANREPGRRPPISAVFDFNSESRTSYAETGTAVPVDGVICESPPTPGETGVIPGQDWEASPANLDFALMQLAEPAPAVRAPDGTLVGRGRYVLDPDSYDFARSGMLIIAQHPLRDFLKFSYITRPPTINFQATRIGYQGNTLMGSSGGPVVDTRGNLVALHHYSGRGRNQGVPASAIARHLGNSRYAGLFETKQSAGPAHFGV